MKNTTYYYSALLLLFFVSCTKNSLDVQGHRGARGLRPENTLAGFEFAMELGVTTLELDIAVTKDRSVVVTHNPYVSAHLCLNGDGTSIKPDSGARYSGPLIRDLTLEEIKGFDCGSINPDTARLPEPPRINIPGEQMPTLIEVFNLIVEKKSSVFLNIEMKIDPRYDVTIPENEFVNTVVNVIQESGMKDRINLQSFNWRSLALVKQIDPEIKTAGLLGSRSFKALNDSTPSPWLNGIHFSEIGGSALGILEEAKSYIDIFSPSWRLVVPDDSLFLHSTVQEIQKAGFPVIPWTANKQLEMEMLIELGVDGIITDYPDSLNMVLKKLQLRRKK
jgi:glycerophosphoryl diester phosphodiesterase